MCIVSGKVFLKLKGMRIGEIRRDWVQTSILNLSSIKYRQFFVSVRVSQYEFPPIDDSN